MEKVSVMAEGGGGGSGVVEGLLVVDKPLGWTSMEVVRRVRRAAGGVKTGHAGTLDPLATGVVVCCLGRATRLVGSVMGLTKVYQARVDLSAVSDTDDLEGRLTPVGVVERPSRERVVEVLGGFVGRVMQRPPDHSAVRVGGQRAYKVARRGGRPAVSERAVRIDAIELLGYGWPVAELRVVCGKGTYIRSLARDVGRALGTGGHLAGLRRLAVGPYDLSVAVGAERLGCVVGRGDVIGPGHALYPEGGPC